MGLPWKRATTRDRPSTNSHSMECTNPLWFDVAGRVREGEIGHRGRSGRSAEEGHDNDKVRTFVGDWVR